MIKHSMIMLILIEKICTFKLLSALFWVDSKEVDIVKC